jgi:hypothetical protein
MGIIALAGLLVYLVVGLLCLSGAIRSVLHGSSLRLYWVVALTSGALFPMLVPRAPPRPSGGEYAGLSYFLEGAFSIPSAVCFIGGLFCFIGSFGKGTSDKVLSGASWGFLSAYVVHLVVLVVR